MITIFQQLSNQFQIEEMLTLKGIKKLSREERVGKIHNMLLNFERAYKKDEIDNRDEMIKLVDTSLQIMEVADSLF